MGKTKGEVDLMGEDTQVTLKPANCEICSKYPSEGTD